VVAPGAALAIIREAVEVLRNKHTKKACARHGSFVCIKERDAKKLASDLQEAETYLDGLFAEAVKTSIGLLVDHQ
jgi:hypothetical protein